MARKGCQVFAFDPTLLPLPSERKKNVVYYPWGIRNSATSTTWVHPIYGNITGSLFTLPEIVKKLGHDDGRSITALKFDCEGCEFGAFKDVVDYEQRTGKKFNQILALSTEFHLSKTLGMVDSKDVADIHFAQLFLESQKCKVNHFKSNDGFIRDREILTELVQGGIPDGICCYEYGFSCGR